MLVTLEEVRLNKSTVKDGHFDWGSADQAFAEAFRADGVDVEALSVEVAAARIRACRIRAELAAVLDSWAFSRRSARPGSDRSWRTLLTVAREADPDEWRGRLRNVVLEGRGVGGLVEVAKLEKSDTLSASTVGVVIAAVESEKGDLAPVMPLLRRAQQKHPDDFWVNHDLAWALDHMQPPQAGRGHHLLPGCRRSPAGKSRRAREPRLLPV